MESHADYQGCEETKLDAVVLAGGVNNRVLYPGYEPGYKALVEIGGKPLIQYVLEALRGSRCVSRIGVVGPEADMAHIVGDDVQFAPAQDSLLGSLTNALKMFSDSPLIMLVTADLAMVQSHMIDNFLALSLQQHTDYADNLYLALTPRDYFTGEFAKCGKAYNAFRDLQICHGNLALMTPSLLNNDDAMSRIDAMYAGRKNPIASAKAIGLGLGLAYVFGVHYSHILTLEKMAEMASKRFNIGFVPVLVEYPEVAIDIDEPGDYEIAKRILTGE